MARRIRLAQDLPRLGRTIMIKRLLFFTYGLACYAVFFATFLYAIGFVGGFVVPTTLDGPLRARSARRIAIDCALLWSSPCSTA